MHDCIYFVPTSEQNDRYVSWGTKSISQAQSRAGRIFHRRNFKDMSRLGKVIPPSSSSSAALVPVNTSTSTSGFGIRSRALLLEHLEDTFLPIFTHQRPLETMGVMNWWCLFCKGWPVLLRASALQDSHPNFASPPAGGLPRSPSRGCIGCRHRDAIPVPTPFSERGQRRGKENEPHAGLGSTWHEIC